MFYTAILSVVEHVKFMLNKTLFYLFLSSKIRKTNYNFLEIGVKSMHKSQDNGMKRVQYAILYYIILNYYL